MARSNTFYWNICYPRHWSCDEEGWYVDENGICSDCRWRYYGQRVDGSPLPPGSGIHRHCIVERDIPGRRGIWKRRRRYHDSLNWCQKGPPADLKQMWHRQARSKQKQEFRRNPDDPMITSMKRLVNKRNWY